jgi:hypothetical protein
MAVTGTRVTPVIGWLERDLQGCKLLQLSTAEVDTAFTVPIAHLLNPAFKSVNNLLIVVRYVSVLQIQ